MVKSITCTLLCALLSVSASSVSAQDRPTHIRTIEVLGEGEVTSAPNEVVLNLGIETLDKSLEKAKQENDRRVNEVLRTLRAAGIEDRFIQAAQVSIEPNYDYRPQGRVFLGFTVRRNLMITLRDLSKLEDVTAKTVSAGITSIFNYEYRSTEMAKLQEQARLKAVDNAASKARALAPALGLTLGKAYSVVEETGRPFYPGLGRARDGAMSSEAMPAPFIPGEIIIRTFVRVIYEVQ